MVRSAAMMFAVGERGAARDHVHRRRGDDGEHVIGCHVGGGRGGCLAVQRRERREARGRRVAELIPVRHRALARRPAGRHAERRRVDHHHRGRGALQHPLHFLAGESPVDRVGDDALARARAVEVQVGGIVLGEDTDPLALADPEPGQASRQGVHSPLELAERDQPLALDDGRRLAVDGGAPRDHVVDGKAVHAHAAEYSRAEVRFDRPARPGPQ